MPHRKLPIIALFMVLALVGIASIRPAGHPATSPYPAAAIRSVERLHPAAATQPAATLGPTAILPPTAATTISTANPIRHTGAPNDPTYATSNRSPTSNRPSTNNPDTSQPRKPHPKADADPTPNQNLKVLPKNLTDDQMEVIMTRYEKQLGVTCLYCHVKTKPDVFPERMDFASDEKPEKSIAREMIRMTNRINYKYFGGKKHEDILRVQTVVTCKTCHRGLPKPII
jgi:hypothetical protein